MKKYLICFMCLCTMGVSVQALVIEDFSGNLSAWTSTVILDNANPAVQNTSAWQISNGVLQLNTTVRDGTSVEQYAMIKSGVGLPVGAELQVDITHTGASQDIGLYVGGTTPVFNIRRDYVAVYARDNGQVFSRGFDGTTEYGLTGGGSPAYQKLFIARTAVNTFETGYYENGVRNIVTTRTPTTPNDADVVGIYADVRAVGVLGNADNLVIISKPTNPTVDQTDGENGVDATLNWSAATDPLGVESVDPDIVDQYVFVSGDNLVSDPNLYYVGATGDPGTVSASMLNIQDLLYETTYNWAVVEALDGHEQTLTAGVSTLDDADPNNTIGPTWSFTTIPEQPTISAVSPAFTAVDAALDPNVFLSVTGQAITSYQWYKEGLGALSNGAKYQGANTPTLTIIDVDQTDEGYYYCVGSKTGLTDAVSEPGRVMIQRLTSHYEFEEIYTPGGADANSYFLDSEDGYHAVLRQDGPDAGWPTYLNDANAISGLGAYLYLNNENSQTDPNGQYLQIFPGVVDYEDLTVTFWVQSTNIDLWQRVFDFGDGESSYLFFTPDLGDNYDPRFSMRVNSGTEQRLQADLNSSNWIGPGHGWHFIAITIVGDTGKIHVNGEWSATNTSMTVDPIDVGAVLNYIGKSQYAADPEFSGYIDDLKIYNYARTNEQIGQDYLTVAGGDWICDREGWNADSEMMGYDTDNDCDVDLVDFAAFANRWLDDIYQISLP